MSCHEKTVLYTCIAKNGEDQLCGNCAADNRHYFRSIFRPPDKSVYWKIILYFSLNQAGGVPCSLTNSTGKFNSNPKHMLRALKRTVSMRRFF